MFFPVGVRVPQGGQVFVTAASAGANCFSSLRLAESELEDTLPLSLPEVRCPELRTNWRLRQRRCKDQPDFIQDYVSGLTYLSSHLLEYFKWLPNARRMKLKLLSGAHWGPAVPRLIAHAELVLNVLAVDRPPRLGTGCPFCPERPSLLFHLINSYTSFKVHLRFTSTPLA